MKKSRKKHKIIEQIQQRPIKTHICVQKGCKFSGELAQQGVCFDTGGELVEWDALDEHDKQLTAELQELKKREGKDYVRALEAHYITAMMNWQLTQDECIRLRRDLALLKKAP